MTNPGQPRGWTSRMRLGAASAALTLVVVPVSGVVPTQSAQAETFTVLHNFTGGSDGGYPYAGLVRDAAGNLYGTTPAGGTYSAGTVFKVSKTGKETVLHSFGAGTDGKAPYGGLVRDVAGNLYGTTSAGGTYGAGTVFKLSKTYKETALCTFGGQSGPGTPSGGVVRDTKGNLYGVTYEGGSYNYGLVYKCKAGTLTVLYVFTGGADGAYPYGSLLIDAEGNLYGITYEGGTHNAGVVFELRLSGGSWMERGLYSFAGGTTDGCYPRGTPAMDKHSNLYGTTSLCGSSGEGTVWKLSKKRTETVLHSFAGGPTDGAYPYAGVIVDVKGNVYGDTYQGGSDGYGTVYGVNKEGERVLLYSLTASDGTYPEGGVIQDAKGSLYGTAVDGGSDGFGTVWKLTP